MSDLHGVVVAFDLDNTLLDATGARYDAVTSQFLAGCDLGLGEQPMHEAYERVRGWGPIFARLGLGNPLHDRGHVDGLAAMVLLFAESGDLLDKAEVAVANRDAFVALLDDLDRVARLSRRGSPQDRLEVERCLRDALVGDSAIALAEAIRSLSSNETLVNWSRTHDDIENARPTDDVYALLQDVIARGATCVVITQGQSKFQRKKLERMGIARLLSGRILITQDARRVAGYELLNQRIDALLARDDTTQELDALWTCRCLLDTWGCKSQWFYGRCLHALHAGGGNVEKRLASITLVDRASWTAQPLRFVMIGDRYEKDILPLIDLLGQDRGLTVHLRAGKYNEDFDETELAQWTKPSQALDDMQAVRRFLETQLTADLILPIDSPPAIVPDGWFDDALLSEGEKSDLACVRAIVQAERLFR